MGRRSYRKGQQMLMVAAVRANQKLQKCQASKVGIFLGLIKPNRDRSAQTTHCMQQFFSDTETIKANIGAIREAAKTIADINQNVLQATTSNYEQLYRNQLEPLVKATNKKATIAKQLLQRLREDTERLKTPGSGALRTPEIRIRENLTNTLTRKFVDVVKEYQSAQSKYKTDIKKKVKRQVHIVKPDATTEEIDAVFRSGGGSGSVFQSAILSVRHFHLVHLAQCSSEDRCLQGEGAEAVRNAYQNVADKYQDVLTLEASVAELHQMFLDFAMLTDKQGDLLDQIEHQVKESEEYIDQGNTEMVEAIGIQKSIRAKQCCIALVVLVILGIVIGVIAAKAAGGM
jgi:t-SNARE complex subunit (syntaxin)